MPRKHSAGTEEAFRRAINKSRRKPAPDDLRESEARHAQSEQRRLKEEFLSRQVTSGQMDRDFQTRQT